MARPRTMPSSAYYRTIATIRDYPRMVYEYNKLQQQAGAKAANYDGMPKATTMNSGVEDMAIKMADLQHDIDRVQKVIDTIPEDMREGIINNIVHGMRFPVNEWGQLVPSLRTWQREKQLFVVRVAHEFRFYA